MIFNMASAAEEAKIVVGSYIGDGTSIYGEYSSDAGWTFPLPQGQFIKLRFKPKAVLISALLASSAATMYVLHQTIGEAGLYTDTSPSPDVHYAGAIMMDDGFYVGYSSKHSLNNKSVLYSYIAFA